MLEQFRRASNTWAARGLFMLLVFSFAIWGIGGDMLNRITRGGAVITVAGQNIEMPQVQEAYRRQLAQLTRMLGGQTDPSPEMRRMVLNQTVEQMINEAALGAAASGDGFVVPDDVLRDAVYHMREFQDQNGQFDRTRFESVLRQAGYSEPRFLDLMRAQLAVQQMLGAAGAGAYVPDNVARDIFAYQQEKRIADTVEFAFAAAPDPAPPSEDVLRRWWDNHPESYSTKEYRRVKVVILSPETLAADVQVSDEDLHAAYDQHKSEYVVPSKRSIQAILASDETAAQGLAAKWREGATWDAMEEAAKAAGATAVTLDDASRGEFPATELADAVFAATPESVPDPVKSPLGWYVIKVVKVDAGTDRGFDEVKDELRQGIARDRATNLLYDRINKVEDAIANSNGLNEVPTDLGLAGVTGTMDADGNTNDGQPAPIPGAPQFRTAIAQAAFKTAKGEAPKLTEVPGAERRHARLFCPRRRRHHPARARAVRDGARQGSGRLDRRRAAKDAGCGRDGGHDRDRGRPVDGRCRHRRRRHGAADAADRAGSGGARGRRAAAREAAVRPQARRGDDDRDAGELRRRGPGRSATGRSGGRPGRVQPPQGNARPRRFGRCGEHARPRPPRARPAAGQPGGARHPHPKP